MECDGSGPNCPDGPDRRGPVAPRGLRADAIRKGRVRSCTADASKTTSPSPQKPGPPGLRRLSAGTAAHEPKNTPPGRSGAGLLCHRFRKTPPRFGHGAPAWADCQQTAGKPRKSRRDNVQLYVVPGGHAHRRWAPLGDLGSGVKDFRPRPGGTRRGIFPAPPARRPSRPVRQRPALLHFSNIKPAGRPDSRPRRPRGRPTDHPKVAIARRTAKSAQSGVNYHDSS